MKSYLIILFGEAEKGALKQFHFCSSAVDLFRYMGHPHHGSESIAFALKSLSFGYPVSYYRVEEEGTNDREYFFGLQLLREFFPEHTRVGALFLPKVSSPLVIREALTLCERYHSSLLVEERDFYDLMTAA